MSHDAWMPPVLAAIIIILGIIGALRINRCRHFWELVDKTEFPSIIEEYLKRGVQIEASYFFSSTLERMGIKRVVIVLRCTRCGESRIEKIDSGP